MGAHDALSTRTPFGKRERKLGRLPLGSPLPLNGAATPRSPALVVSAYPSVNRLRHCGDLTGYRQRGTVVHREPLCKGRYEPATGVERRLTARRALLHHTWPLPPLPISGQFGIAVVPLGNGKAACCGGFSIGAPRFELGTSSPPGSFWRAWTTSKRVAEPNHYRPKPPEEAGRGYRLAQNWRNRN
jgi:hypothetical protein